MDNTSQTSKDGLIPLADISRQLLRVGTPPVFLFTEAGHRIDRDLVMLSVQLRQAEALERIADALEAGDHRDTLAESVKIYGGGQPS